MSHSALRLVVSPGKSIDDPTTTTTTTTDERVAAVFAYWVWMFKLDPERTAFGPARRQAIERAIALYPSAQAGQECCELAIEGNAASAWAAGANQTGRTFNSIEWILRDDASIERWMRDGERVRAQLARNAEPAPASPHPQAHPQALPQAHTAPPAIAPRRAATQPPLSPEAQAARERLRQFCADVRRRPGA